MRLVLLRPLWGPALHMITVTSWPCVNHKHVAIILDGRVEMSANVITY